MVDIDHNELHKINVRPDIPICCDAKDFMELILKYRDKISLKDRNNWFGYCNKVKSKYPLIPDEYWQQKDKVNTYCLIETITKYMRPDDIYVSGSSGSCIEISMQAFKVKKGQRVFCTKALASMGYGLPSSIGACLASGNKRIVGVNGDGGFIMNVQELETIRRLNLPIKIFVLNNHGYSAIYSTQSKFFNRHFVACDESSNLSLPNVLEIAKAFGLKTDYINNNSELDTKIKNILDSNEPMIIEVNTPIELSARPKQISYKCKNGQIESLPLEYMAPEIPENELIDNMLIPLYIKN